MSPNLVPGVYKIVSLIAGNPPTSVGLNLLPQQTVHLNGPVRPWVVRKEGRDTYRLSVIGYPYTGVIHDKVTASIQEDQNLEWRATYREHQDAYTIEPVNDQNKGWTAPGVNSPNAEIVIKPITFLPGVPHGNYQAHQLFKFVPLQK